MAGTATTNGVAALAGAVAPLDAPAVAHLREAGAIPIGRTNLPDFQLRWHTDNALAGATRNPWDAALTPGGSSGGEAAALATGMTPLGLGTDLGGSVRFPSQCCGTAALRPTLGRVAQAASTDPADPPLSLQLMSVVGPMARRVGDLRAAFEVLRRPSDRDPWYAPVEVPAQAPGAPLRVAVVTGLPAHPDVAGGVRRAAAALADAGYEVDELDPPALQDAAATWLALMAHELGLLWPVLEAVASPGAIAFLTDALAGRHRDAEPGPAAYEHALIGRHALARAWAGFQRSHPLILGPVSTRPPFAAGADLGGREAAAGILDSLALTMAVNVTGLPSVAVPVGLAGGLPQGVQLIGPRWREDLCLDAAATVEAATGVITPIDPRP